MRRRADLLLSEMKHTEHTRILEIGCGTGEISFWIAQQSDASILGTDLCTPFIEKATQTYQRKNLRYAVLDFNKADEFQGEKFDYIIGNGILHHLYQQLDDACLHMKDLLNEGGKIIFLEPNYHNPYVYSIFTFPWLRKLAKLEPDEMAFTNGYIRKKLLKNSYVNIQIDYRDFLLPCIPEFLITPSIILGNILENIPFLRGLSQSLFIRAEK